MQTSSRNFLFVSALAVLAFTALPAAAADAKAKVLTQTAPDYPKEAARHQIEGWVEVEFTVGVDGTVSGVSVLDAKPRRMFEKSAVQAIKQWTFEPAVKGDQPVQSVSRLKISFTL